MNNNSPEWLVAICMAGMIFGVGAVSGLVLGPPRMDGVVVAARVTDVRPGERTPHIKTAQLGVHMRVNVSAIQARAARHWQCVYVQWNPSEEEWVFAGDAPDAACVDRRQHANVDQGTDLL